MSSTDESDTSADDPLERAQARLEAACASLAARFDSFAQGERSADPAQRASTVSERSQNSADIAALEAALEAAKLRESELSSAAQDASRSLAAAIEALDQLAAEEDGS